MPRRNRPKRERPTRPKIPSTTSPIFAPEGWHAQRYRGGEANREYVCPGCTKVVPQRSEHVVAWLVDEDERRRHWHTGCWETAVREGIDRYRWV